MACLRPLHTVSLIHGCDGAVGRNLHHAVGPRAGPEKYGLGKWSPPLLGDPGKIFWLFGRYLALAEISQGARGNFDQAAASDESGYATFFRSKSNMCSSLNAFADSIKDGECGQVAEEFTVNVL
jgi:hypothetical protein